MYEEIGKIFNFIPETNITSKDIYHNRGVFPVYSGNTVGQGIVGYINYYKENQEYLTFTSYGTNAGKLMYRNEKSTVGRNCIGLRLKDEYSGKINLEWFSYAYQNLFYKSRSNNKSGQKKLNKKLLEHVKISIPEFEVQVEQLTFYKMLDSYKISLEKINSRIETLLDKKIKLPDEDNSYIYQGELKKFFNLYGGNSGLTNENIYKNLINNKQMLIPVYSGSKENKRILGKISTNAIIKGKIIKKMNGPAIIVIRKGAAGTMRFVDDKEFTINDDVYVLSPKDKYKEIINLLWFIYEYESLFKTISTAKNGNGTFSKSYAEQQHIKIPKKSIQDSIAKGIFELESNKVKIKNILLRINELLSKDIDYI